MSSTHSLLRYFTLLIVLSLLIISCKKGGNSGTNSAKGKKFKIEVEYESTLTPSSDVYKLKDKGNYNVDFSTGKGIVSQIVNPDANLVKVSGSCTNYYQNGPGPINIRSIDFMSAEIDRDYVIVQFDDSKTVQLPILTISADCTGSDPGIQDFGISPAITGSFRFTDNGKAQVMDFSTAGVTLIYTVTPIQ